jgi:acetyl esterase/lipase
MSLIELTRFTVRAENTQAMLDARSGMIEAFRQDRRGFVSARLVRVGRDTWLDFVEWIDDTAWDESKSKGPNRPEIAAFFDTIDTLVSSARGVRYDDAEDGQRPVRTIAYGPAPSQVGELYLPFGSGPFPVVVLVHGGFWTALFDRRVMTRLADDLVTLGYAVWNIEYRRIGEAGTGWPDTFTDVAAAIDILNGLEPVLDLTRVAVVGHSAGGHLAAWAAARSTLPARAPGSRPGVALRAAVSLAGVLDLVAADAVDFGTVLADLDAPPPAGSPEMSRPDLAPAVAARVNDGVVRVLLGGGATEAPDRFAWASPVQLLPVDVPVLAVHGSRDELVPQSHAHAYHRAALAREAPVELVEVPDAGHFELIDPHHPSWAIVRTWLVKHLT